MKFRYLILSISIFGAGETFAARSSERNFKTLRQREDERVAAEKEAKRIAEESARNPGRGGEAKTPERITFLGPKTGWGFVRKESVYYTPEGKNLGDLKAGTLFKYSDVRASSRNDMLLSMIRDESGWHGPYLLPCTGVAAYEGDPEKVDINIVADLRNYFLLKGEHDRRKEELLETEYRKNPHFDAYQSAARSYRESTDKAGELEAEAGKLTGAQKTRAYEELRELKYRQEKLKVELQNIGAKYKDWKDRHPVNMQAVADERLQALSARMEEVRKRIPDLIPPEE